MNNIKKKLIPLIFSAFLISTTGCSNSPTTGTTVDTKVGTKVDAAYVVGFLPKAVAGQKYTYISTQKKGAVESSNQVSAEVLEVTNESKMLKLRLESKDGSSILPVDLSKPPTLPPSGITYEGKENLSVKGGTFKTTKFSFSSATSSFNAWLFEEVGIIKVIEQKNNGDTVTTELIEFKK